MVLGFGSAISSSLVSFCSFNYCFEEELDVCHMMQLGD